MNRNKVFPKGGCLIFFGDIFGGRFHENYHQIISHVYDETQKVFRIHFIEGETCTIYEPENIIYSQEAFVIQEASHIIWEWYYYGREKAIENMNSWDFSKIDNSTISKAITGNLGNSQITFDRKSQPALQFV